MKLTIQVLRNINAISRNRVGFVHYFHPGLSANHTTAIFSSPAFYYFIFPRANPTENATPYSSFIIHLVYERQYGKNNVPLNRVTRAAILGIFFF